MRASLKNRVRSLYRRGLRASAVGDGVVLMFHSIPTAQAIDDRLIPNPSMESSPRFLEQVIDHFQAQGYSFVCLDALAERVRGGRRGERFACVTFDDGYRDNLLCAHPILAERGVPYTVFVITGFPDGAVVHYGAITHHWVASSDVLRIRLGGRLHVLPAGGQDEKIESLRRLRALISGSLKGSEIKGFLEDMGAPMGQHTLSWAELAEMAQHLLATIGAHTINHPKLTSLDATAARREIEGSKHRLEEVLGQPVRHFAYPFGAAGAREFGLARAAGFETMSTVKPGRIAVGRTDLAALPRVRAENGRLDLLETGLAALRTR